MIKQQMSCERAENCAQKCDIDFFKSHKEASYREKYIKLVVI